MATYRERFNTRTRGTVLGVIALGAVLVAGCSRGADPTAVQAQALRTLNSPGLTPILVTCEANQHTLVRQAVVNGEMVSQVSCVSATVSTGATGYAEYAGAPLSPIAGVAMPVSYTQAPDVPMARPAVFSRGESVTYPAAYPTAERRVRAAPRRVVYQDAPAYRVRSGRSWKKSALIIGSSAGIGAGVGAAVGGKKGALIGAAIGGGGATVWDQVTRRDR